MPRPIEATIDASALRHNYRRAKAAMPAAQAWAVVKANAYGHGLLRAAAALGDLADGFALLDLEEAVRLREAGIRQPILLLEGFFRAADLEVIAAHGLATVVHCRPQVEMLVASPVRPPLFLKFNTGMNRLGFTAADLAWLDQRLPAIAGGGLTLMTHFADADGERGVAWQLENFRRLRPDWNGAVSLANSAAILRYPEVGGSWSRPGIMLYGGSPFAELSAAALGLLPVMTLSSEVIGVQQLRTGDRVGYGCSFAAPAAMRIGVVACGYADGYPRHAPGGTPILVDGALTRTVGRVSMDMLAVDLTTLPVAGIGSPVTLWGQGLAADDVAASAGTISYELFCALAPRVPVRQV